MSALLGVYCVLAVTRADIFLARAGLFPSPIITLVLVLIVCALLTTIRSPTRALTSYNGAGFVLAPLALFAAIALLQLPRTPNADDGAKYALLPAIDLMIIAVAFPAIMLFASFQAWRRCLVAALIVLVLSVGFDAAVPGALSRVISRPAGFAENPNQTSLVTCVLLALSINYRRLTSGSLLLLAIGGLTVLATLSRSGVVLFGVLVLGYFTQVLFNSPLQLFRRSLLVGVTIAVGVIGGAALLDRMPAFEAAAARQRIDSLFGDAAFVGGDDARLLAAEATIQRIDRNLVFGQGPGAGELLHVPPHNMYLNVWLDFGLPGLAAYCLVLFCGLSIAVWALEPRAIVFWSIVWIAGFFSHNLLEDKAILLGIPTAILLCARWEGLPSRVHSRIAAAIHSASKRRVWQGDALSRMR